MRVRQMCGVVVVLLTGASAADVLVVPDQYTTIQSAIEAAVTGDIVQVQSGIYNETIDFLGKAITVAGESADTTTIDGTGLAGSVVRFVSEENQNSTLETIRIIRGSGEIVSDPVFGDVLCGGGIIVRSASPTLFGCVVEFNAAWGGAGMCNVAGSPHVNNCIFRNNASEGHGGGMYNLDGSHPLLEGCRFESNTASWGGGMTNTTGSNPEMLACDFWTNVVFNVGGGMFNRSSSSPVLTGCSFYGNEQVGNPLGSGGGMCTYGAGTGGGLCYPVVTSCSFVANSVMGDGGGMANAYGAHPTVTDSSFVQNTCGRDGGGVACVGEDNPDYPSNGSFEGCWFDDNEATARGGGFFSRRSEPSIINCSAAGNLAAQGGGVYFFESSAATMGASRICGNAMGQIGGAYIDLGGNSVNEVCEDCVADITGDGTVGVDDLLDLIASFGPCAGCPADVDGDGVVGVDDILIVLAAWGVCP
jgi:hypothetical protein